MADPQQQVTPPAGFVLEQSSGQATPPPGFELEKAKGSAPADRGFVPGIKRGALNIVNTVHQFGSDLANPAMPVLLSDRPEDQGSVADRLQGESMLGRYLLQPAAAEKKRSLEEARAFHNTSGLPAIGHGINTFIHTAGEFVPLIGPIVGSLVDRAEAGDVSGAVGEGLTYKVGPRVLRGIGAKALDVARDVPGVRAVIPTTEGLGRAIGRNTPEAIARPAIQWAEGVRPVEAKPSVALAPTVADPYAGVDQLRAKLTSPAAMAARPVEGTPPPPSQRPVGPYAGLDELRGKLTSSPAALAAGVRPVEAPAEARTPSAGERVTKAPDIAKVEAPSVKPVAEAKPSARVATSGVEPAFRAASTDMSQADLVKLAKRYGIDTTKAAISRKAGPYSLARHELVEQIIESADPADLAEITRTLEMRGPGIKPVSGPTTASRAASDAAFKRNFPNEKVPESWGIDFRSTEKPIDTDPFAKATEQARRELGPSASTGDVISLRNKLVGDLPETRDVGARVRATNPEPTREEVRRARSLRGQ